MAHNLGTPIASVYYCVISLGVHMGKPVSERGERGPVFLPSGPGWTAWSAVGPTFLGVRVYAVTPSLNAVCRGCYFCPIAPAEVLGKRSLFSRKGQGSETEPRWMMRWHPPPDSRVFSSHKNCLEPCGWRFYLIVDFSNQMRFGGKTVISVLARPDLSGSPLLFSPNSNT